MLTALALCIFASPLGASSADPNTTVDVDGEVRLRLESYNESDLNDAVEGLTTDGETFLLRTRLGFDARPNDRVRLYIQAQDSRVYGQEPTTAANTANLDLHQGYLELSEINGLDLTLQVGRMELSYGDQRIIGAFDWHNVGRSFDAVRVRSKRDPGLTIDGFYARLHHDRSSGSRALGDDFAGVYATYEAADYTVDGYGFYLHDKGGPVDFDGDGTADGPRFPDDDGTLAGGRYHLATVGARFDGKFAGAIGVNGEAAVQAGKRGNLDIMAFAAHLDGSYKIAAVYDPTINIGYDLASGDSDPTDDSWGTFENLFPTNHLYYGYLDLGAWKNINSVHAGVAIAPKKKALVKVQVHALMRLDDADTFYRASGAPLRTTITGVDSKYVGTEADLLVKWPIYAGMSLLGGLSYLMPGAFLDDTDTVDGSAPSPFFGYLQLVAKF